MEQEQLNLDWYRSLKSCLDKCCSGSSNIVSVNVYGNIRSAFVKNWECKKDISPKLEFYRSIKSNLEREEYLTHPVMKFRSALTRLRISAHDLEIERGRYQIQKQNNSDDKEKNKNMRKSREERTCRYCMEVLHIKATECENHVLNDCLLYIKHRYDFLGTLNLNLADNVIPVTDIMKNIFNKPPNNNSEIDIHRRHLIHKFAKMCSNIFDHRKAFHDFLDDYND